MPGQEPGAKPTKSIYMPYGASGGGGEGGTYVFTDLPHLDATIAKWTTLRDDIANDGKDLDEAIRKIVPPADDTPSVTQAKAVNASLTKGQQHNTAMYEYADGYIQKLMATRTEYAATEDTNTDALRNTDTSR